MTTTLIQKAAEELRNTEIPQHTHVLAPQMSVCEMFAQGDIGILRIGSLPKGSKKCDMPAGGQVAPGTSKGSRHCVDLCDAQFYRFQGDVLSDLCIDAKTAWTLRHPEHGHVTFGPGLYQFVHQQNERNERIRD